MSARVSSGPEPSPANDRTLIAIFCLAQVLGMLGNSTFPALIPQFQSEWALSNTQAGWITGVYYGGYVAAVPLLVTLTDRKDPWLIYLSATVLGFLAALGFALLAEGLWTAVVFRMLGGISLAGTYMVGLKLLSDRVDKRRQSRAVAIYTAHFGIGVAVSILLAGEVASLAGWRVAFLVAAGGSLLAFLLIWLRVAPSGPLAPVEGGSHALDLRPVFRNRPALAFILGYAAHIWELFGLRAWVVAFLAFAYGQQGAETTFALTPTQVAFLVLLVGMPASILGNELALRLGRRPAIGLLMMASAVLSLSIGFLSGLPLWLLALLLILYGGLTMADSGALTAGAVLKAAPGRLGATMAVHALLGFGSGVLAPLAFGLVLDLAGGNQNPTAWGLAFALLALSAVVGLPILARLGRR